MSECKHTYTRRRAGESGYYCEACGELVMDVDARPCGGCARIVKLIGGHSCTRHMMAVVPGMHVTFYVREGSCWTAPEAVQYPVFGQAASSEEIAASVGKILDVRNPGT